MANLEFLWIVFILSQLLNMTISTPLYTSQFFSTDTARNIRHLPCVSLRTGETGVCMFAFNCVKANGTHLGTCLDRFYFGSCCKIADVPEVFPQDNSIEDSTSKLPTTTSKPIESNDIPDYKIKPKPEKFPSTKKPLTTTTAAPSPSTTGVSIGLSTFQTVQSSHSSSTKAPPTSQIYSTLVPKTPPTTETPTTKQTTTVAPKSTSTVPTIDRNPPATRFPPRNVTTTTTSTTTRRPTITRTTSRPSTRPSVIVTKKPISTTVTKRPISPSRRPPSTTVKPASTSSKPTNSSISFTNSSATGIPTKRPSSTTNIRQTTTARPSTIAKPPNTTSSKPKPSTQPPKITSTISVKPSTSSTTQTTDKRQPTTSTVKPTTSKLPNVTQSTWSTTEATTEATAKVPVTTAAPSTTAPSTSKLTTTMTNEILLSTVTPGIITWSSNSDDGITESPVLSSTATTQQSDANAETEWSPITTPDGWIIIQSPSTKKPEITEEPASETKPTKVPSTTVAPSTYSTTERITTLKPTVPTAASSSVGTSSIPVLTTQSPMPTDHINMSDFKQVCGRRFFPESRIVGGERSAFGKWPWQISLRQWRTSAFLHKCGAALLNENWAITAAHCVENVPPSDLLLRMGEHDLANEDEPYGFQERRVQIVASHPQFDPRTFEYDLALLRFYEPLLPFQPNLLPICLPDDDEGYVGHTAYVTGWGRLYEEGPLPSILQEVSVPVINNTVCESMYRNAGYIEHIPHIFICAGRRKGGFDSCEGDSGGPMVIQRPRDKRWILAGVISWGIGCAEPNQPGVYTRISEFREWINQILQF